MSYYRHRFSSIEEFRREGLFSGDSLGKEELELLEALEDEDQFDSPKRRRRSQWDC